MKKMVVLGACLLITVSSHAGLYRWVDEAGNVHFSDKIPAAASTKGHAKLSKSGGVTKEIDPTLKQKKLDELEAIKLEKEQMAELREIKAEAQAMIKQRDNNLLSTYENEGELIKFFETKIRMVEGNSRILEAQKSVLNKKIVKLEGEVVATSTEAMQSSITKKMLNISKTIEQYKKALIENEEQLLKLSENYQNDLTRFNELTK